MRLVAIAAICLCAHAQGLPPRTAPTEYQAQGKAGDVTIAAEFKGHSVPTAQGPLTAEDYVSVEVGFFGAADARVKIAAGDFSLRVNGKKAALPAQAAGLVTVKDPEWEPPIPVEPKAKTSLGGGGGGGRGGRGDGGDSNKPPEPPPVPFPVRREWTQRRQKATLPEGDRAMPQAGLIYFQYRGKTSGIHSLELIYAGSAGKVTLTLQP